MLDVNDKTMFKLIRKFFEVYLPNQRNVSPNTVAAYKKSMNEFVDYLKDANNVIIQEVTSDMIDSESVFAFLDYLEKTRGCSISTRNHRLTAIRAFFTYAANNDVTMVAILEEIAKVPNKKPENRQLAPHMSEQAIQTILSQPNTSTTKGFRDMVFMALMYDLGARCQEMIDIKLRGLRLGKMSTVTLHGKGDKERTVPLMPRTAALLRQYLKIFHNKAALDSNANLFYLVSHGLVHPLSNDCVARFVRKYGESAREVCAEVPENVHPHLFRHSRAMHLYQNGMDLTLVSQWLGHAQIETTRIYAYADTEHKRKAIEKATPENSPLREVLNPARYIISDEEQIKILYGLR